MHSTPLFDRVALDLLAAFQDAGTASEVDIGWREVVQALVVAAVIVMLDEVGDGAFEVTGQVIVFKQDSAFEREVSALDFALGHRVVGFAARVLHALVFEPLG